MGIYLNPGDDGFRTKRNGTYVDKTGMITLINERINTTGKLVCVCRPRRFGKSTAAQMLAAYYGCGQDTSELFDDLKIAEDPSYRKHLNQIQRAISGNYGIYGKNSKETKLCTD